MRTSSGLHNKLRKAILVINPNEKPVRYKLYFIVEHNSFISGKTYITIYILQGV